MNAIIPDIDTLKKVVKINATLPDEAINQIGRAHV